MRYPRRELRESPLYSTLLLENIVSHKSKHALMTLGSTLILLFVAFLAASIPLPALAPWRVRVIGLFLMDTSFLIFLYCLESFYRSHAFEHITGRDHPGNRVTFEAGRVLFDATDADVLPAFLDSEIGEDIITRLGISSDTLKTLVQEHSAEPKETDLSLDANTITSISDIARALYHSHQDFAHLLSVQEVTEDEFVNAARWVESLSADEYQRERWWSRANLSRIPGVAKDWAYGGTWRLEHYAHDLLLTLDTASIHIPTTRARELSQLQTTLSREKGANAILVGDNTALTELSEALARAIFSGEAVPALEHKRVLLLEAELLTSSFKERAGFVKEFEAVFANTVHAGNIVLVIKSAEGLIAGAGRLGVDIADLLTPFLASPALHVILLSSRETFNQLVSGGSKLLPLFETLSVDPLSQGDLVQALSQGIRDIERRYFVTFTYQAIVAIGESAERYMTTQDTEDKAFDIALEIIPWIRKQGRQSITRNDIFSFVSEKTGIPLGPITEREKGVLLNLEGLLAEDVVGQETALVRIAEALRRNRAQLGNKNRPIGAFLFLGPTGVGKTQTAKALARTLFGSAEHMHRFDMTEFAGNDALPRLIGTRESSGFLAGALRKESYAVLLLDEFEKASEEIRNLFLQILDEGVFHDGNGAKVNARNTIIIATSNAGAQHLWWLADEGKSIEDERDAIIAGIIHDGYFRPELINRFDAVIFFSPLSFEMRKEIAAHLVTSLTQRLADQGVTLLSSDALIEMIAHAGDDKQWGARPMNRFMQDAVESVIAQKKIAGELTPGASIRFTISPTGTPLTAEIITSST